MRIGNSRNDSISAYFEGLALVIAIVCVVNICFGMYERVDLQWKIQETANNELAETGNIAGDPVREGSAEVIIRDRDMENSYAKILNMDTQEARSLVYSEARQNYKSGDLRLSIPAIGFDAPVYGGTDKKMLAKGPGLYEVSAMPGAGDHNVSIAGHRNGVKKGRITKIVFYDLDKVGQGDYMYLYDKERTYTYEFEFSSVVEQNDWSLIYPQGYSCLTLTTCTPIGVADRRLVVRGALIDISLRSLA